MRNSCKTYLLTTSGLFAAIGLATIANAAPMRRNILMRHSSPELNLTAQPEVRKAFDYVEDRKARSEVQRQIKQLEVAAKKARKAEKRKKWQEARVAASRKKQKLFFARTKPHRPRVKQAVVRTTAYTHTEADHIRYRRKNAIGTTLQYGTTKSAAADWSVYPVGTTFKIEGDPSTYIIDDYGSALVGTKTVDLYKPSKRAMNHWGVRHVKIRILNMGSYEKSLNILKDRMGYWHVRSMVRELQKKNRV